MIRIEPIALRHAPAIQQLARHPAVLATTLLPNPYPANGAETWIRVVHAQREPWVERPYTILIADTVVGVCGYKDLKTSQQVAELGYWIGHPHWGNGYATQGCDLAIAIGFGQWNLKRITACALERNLASRRVLEKLHFEYVETCRNPYPRWDPNDMMVYYQLTREDWTNRSRSTVASS